jgi:FG-GAP-like repeat/Secretion system C-terminal sorting domain
MCKIILRIIKIQILILLLSFSFACAENLITPQDISDIDFIKSDQNLGNTRTFGIAIEDVDLDNDNDVFIANYIGTSRLWLNDGNGHFTLSTFSSITTEVHDVEIADLNGDNWPDIFVVNHHAPNKIYFNNGSGDFSDSGQNIGPTSDSPDTIQLEDVDGDSDLDALIYNTDAPNRIWLNNGLGLFTITNIDYGGSDANGMKLADFNGDASPDLLICLRTQQNQIWMNDGHGNFTNSGQELGGDVEDTDVKDIDGDGDNDIISVGNNISVWLNQNNSGTFIESLNIAEGAFKCKLIDADLDGDYDLVTAHIENGNMLWLYDGQGSYTSSGDIFGNSRVLSLECKDLDGDNDNDVVFGQLEGTGGNSVYYNESTIVGLNEENSLGSVNYKLYNNYPNPFNPNTIIEYSLIKSSDVIMKVYDSLGRYVRTLVNKYMQSGNHKIIWNGKDEFNRSVSAGVYFYQLTANSFTNTKKMILLE